MNRDTVRANQNRPLLNTVESHPLNPPPATHSSQAQTTINLPNDAFDVNLDGQPISGLFNASIEDRYVPSLIGPSSNGLVGVPGPRRLIPYFHY